MDLRLGAPADVHQYGGERLGEVYVRRYERGVVVVNPAQCNREFVLPSVGHGKYRDVFAKKDLSGENIAVSLPPESGRVYLYR